MVRDERGDKEAGGVVLKKKWGTPKTTLRQKFLHCVSVSNQLQQWTNFCTNFSPKSGGVGDASPLSKKVGTPSPPHYTPGKKPRELARLLRLYVEYIGNVCLQERRTAALTLTEPSNCLLSVSLSVPWSYHYNSMVRTVSNHNAGGAALLLAIHESFNLLCPLIRKS